MKRQRLTWEHLVAQLPPAPEETNLEPPFGFATRVVAQWQDARRDESLRCWASWSFRTALASVAVCAFLALVQNRQGGPILLPLPEAPSPTHLPTPP